ncbi:M23 family peptidase [Luteimonas aestuarii]|uniref:M23 family peptidase n=1 Tax=Luteimonas aestuarii TaxID=453837 RepID=A0A4R5TTU3_9GAMM|nr:peptidoglycan DD-metalloendopeptidase family protein [Luteimonas aestuarii]TDK24442.1 M23 family peptidase [Luteimonas aestuarii]
MRACLASAAILALLVPASADAQSGRIYRWSDLNGSTRYSDRTEGHATQGGIAEIPIRVEPAAVARLRFEHRDGRHLAWIDNTLGGPIEVMVHAVPGTTPASDPPLPARATVPSGQGVVVAVLAQATGLRVEAIPGSPSAQPRDVEYGYPLGTAALRITQAWGGRHSHADAGNRHAVDFAAPLGTTVLAARDGVVMQTEGSFDDAAPDDPDALERANFIRVLHHDGTMALYAHLQPGGVHVRVGQRVRRGQAIGLSGNTGRSTAPHLHFVVQANRGMRLESVPFRMFGPRGILRFSESIGAGD